MKDYVIQSKSGMMNVSVSVKNKMNGVLVRMTICGILVSVTASVTRHVKLTNIYMLKFVHGKSV